jgi:hypothetical protein
MELKNEGVECKPLVQVNVGLLAHNVGETATNTLDGGQGEDDLLLTVDVRVEHTENVLEIILLHQSLQSLINEDGFRLGYRPFGSHGSLATGTPRTTNRIRHSGRDLAHHLCWGCCDADARERKKGRKIETRKNPLVPYRSRRDNSRQRKIQICALPVRRTVAHGMCTILPTIAQDCRLQ